MKAQVVRAGEIDPGQVHSTPGRDGVFSSAGMRHLRRWAATAAAHDFSRRPYERE
jgi:hypothetical protein